MLAAADSGQPVGLKDELGVLALTVSTAESLTVLQTWSKWDQTLTESGVWAQPGARPVSWELPADQVGDNGSREESCQWIWDIVPATAKALAGDAVFLENSSSIERHPFGVTPESQEESPDWAQATVFQKIANSHLGAHIGQVVAAESVWVGQDVELAPSVAIDASAGPVILDRNVKIQPHVFLEGPLYLGPGSTVKAGAKIYGESSFGILNKIAGEIGESTFGDFANKQHDGFIGHAVLGSWVNLGAMTTCSDLKNNYGRVRVDLGFGTQDSGRHFVGLLMGDHAKTAIGSLFNTGTNVGFASNIFTEGMPPKYVGNFKWGGQLDCPDYSLDKAVETAAVVMSRRKCSLGKAHRELFRFLAR